jgi:sugar lactone lactonase YvrE
MDPNRHDTTPVRARDRLRRVWLPLLVVVGVLAVLLAATLRVVWAPGVNPPAAGRAGASGPNEQAVAPAPPDRSLPLRYFQSAVLGGSGSAHPFRRSLTGLAVGPGDDIYALGDSEVRVLDPHGKLLRNWGAPEQAGCLTVAADGRVYVGASDRVEVFDARGTRVGGFTAGEAGQPASITAIKVFGKDILVADASARLIRRYDPSGRPLGVIGNQNKTGSFMLPNDSLDIDVDSRGVIYATDTGRHQVSAWALDGSPAGKFGRFGMVNPEDFVGCCNPVNLALAPDGNVVTAEKMVARVKVYRPDGTLLVVIGPEHFDPDCLHIHLAVDSRGRILAADPVRREIKIFSPANTVGVLGPAGQEMSSRTTREREPV